VARVATLLCMLLAKLAGLAMIMMMFVTLGDIAGRRIFNVPIYGHYEIVQLCLVFVVYGGLAEASRRAVHIKVDLIDTLLPDLTLRLVKLAATFLLASAVLLLAAGALSQIRDAMRFGDIMPDLGISVLWLWGPISFCLLIMLVGVASSAPLTSVDNGLGKP
jgi:TRAP-type C4-dicarboxylate transport system permease small subunit